MQEALRHRGPDDNGHYRSMQTGLAFTRLSIVDVEGGHQPLVSGQGNVLIANGEIYNAPELREAYAHYPFNTQSDCETILALYESHGVDFAEHLRGMYAAAIYDHKTGELILTRDPFGIKPLYYVSDPSVFAFSSELTPLLNAGFAERQLDFLSQLEFLQLKYVTGRKTILPGILRLEPGETIVVKDAKIQSSRKISPWPNRISVKQGSAGGRVASRSSLLAEFSEVIRDSVNVHLRSDVPCCLFYSGGIDSTILMRVASQVSKRKISAITIGYSGQESCDESRNALRLAEAAGIPCDRIEMGFDEFWQLTPRIVASIDDPMADPAALPLYVLARAAADHGYKVAVSGEGADEIFGGYSRYRRAALPGFMRSGGPRRGAFTKIQIQMNRFNDWRHEIGALEAEQTKQWKSRMQVLQAVDVIERLPNCLLVKLDRTLMANGVEGRTPFLDKNVVAFAASIPDRLKADVRLGKRLLRDWLADEFPQAEPYARKRGFEIPLASWLYPRRAELAAMVRAQPGIAGVFLPSEVDAIFEDCQNDKQRAWSLLFYALWHSHHILGIDCRGDIGEVLSLAQRATTARLSSPPRKAGDGALPKR